MAVRGVKVGELVEAGGFVGTDLTVLSVDGTGSVMPYYKRHCFILKSNLKIYYLFISLLCRAE